MTINTENEMPETTDIITVDVRGEICPGPLIATQEAINNAKSGQQIEVLTDFQPAVMMVTTTAVKEGWDIQVQKVQTGEWRLILTESPVPSP